MHGRFLADEEWETGLPQRHCWVVEGATLQFKTSPACTAAAALYTLKRGEEGRVKAACFELRTSLMDLQLAEEWSTRRRGRADPLAATARSRRSGGMRCRRCAPRLHEIGTLLFFERGAAKLVQLYSADDATAKVVEIALEILFRPAAAPMASRSSTRHALRRARARRAGTGGCSTIGSATIWW